LLILIQINFNTFYLFAHKLHKQYTNIWSKSLQTLIFLPQHVFLISAAKKTTCCLCGSA